MIKFKAKIINSDKWLEGTSLIETSFGYVIMKGRMEWHDGSEWTSENSYFNYIDIETLIIEK
jgi:hypothetical protein